MDKPIVKIARLSADVRLPEQARPGDAGFDIYSNDHVIVKPGQSILLPTGLKMEIPEGWCGQINPRSGLASKKKIVVGARIIDSGYRGEIMINIHNNGDNDYEINHRTAVAQILFLPVLTEIAEVKESEMSDTVRGKGGFGSTGRM